MPSVLNRRTSVYDAEPGTDIAEIPPDLKAYWGYGKAKPTRTCVSAK